eukprot:3731430-Rhodomonas_salina.1
MRLVVPRSAASSVISTGRLYLVLDGERLVLGRGFVLQNLNLVVQDSDLLLHLRGRLLRRLRAPCAFVRPHARLSGPTRVCQAPRAFVRAGYARAIKRFSGTTCRGPAGFGIDLAPASGARSTGILVQSVGRTQISGLIWQLVRDQGGF